MRGAAGSNTPWALFGAVRNGAWASLPFLGLFFAGYGWVGGLNLAAWCARRRARGVLHPATPGRAGSARVEIAPDEAEALVG